MPGLGATRPCLLWASSACLHDSTSGAAIQSRIMLECLAASGFDVHVLGCLTFDHPSGTSLFPNYERDIRSAPQRWIRLHERGVAYTYLKTADTALAHMRHSEQRLLLDMFAHMLTQHRPQILMHYGAGAAEYIMRAEAARAGVPSVVAVYNGEYVGYDFAWAERLITDSRATAALYARREQRTMFQVGIFIRPQDCVAPQHAPRYVTFVNPCLHKGVGPFVRLALMAGREMPDLRFLVVESRGRWQLDPAALRDPDNPDWRLDRHSFSHVDIAPHQADMRPVYALTRLLLAPSLWFEGWGRVATEAVMNGIPVLASTSGGLAEAVGEGGRILPLPDATCADHTRLPNEQEMQPWFNALKDMLAPEKYGHWQSAARRAAASHSLEASTGRILEVLRPLLA